MSVTILLFASVAEAVGSRRLEIDSQPGDRVAEIRDRLLAAYPQLERFAPNLLYALDEEYVTLDSPIGDGTTLALIPPVSGGAPCSFA